MGLVEDLWVGGAGRNEEGGAGRLQMKYVLLGQPRSQLSL